MATTHVLMEIGKMLSPVLTVGLGAFLAARYYEKNKRVDFSLKLSEKVLEEVYTPILVMIDNQESILFGEGYKGLSIKEVQEIENIFKKHRHLINPKLLRMLAIFNEDFANVYMKSTVNDPNEALKGYLVDSEEKFLKTIQKENEYHLKRIGFYSKDK